MICWRPPAFTTPRNLQMRDVEMPISAVGDMDVAVRSMRVGDPIDLHVSGEDVYNNGIVLRANHEQPLR